MDASAGRGRAGRGAGGRGGRGGRGSGLLLQAAADPTSMGEVPSHGAPAAPRGLCVACGERERTHAAVPCGHMIWCSGCSAAWLGGDALCCPLCRAQCTGALRVFK